MQKILFYARANQFQAEKKWWARLDSKSKRGHLTRLLKNNELAEAFHALLDYPGLWSDFQLGTLHRILPMRCDEVKGEACGDFQRADRFIGAFALSETHRRGMEGYNRHRRSKSSGRYRDGPWPRIDGTNRVTEGPAKHNCSNGWATALLIYPTACYASIANGEHIRRSMSDT